MRLLRTDFLTKQENTKHSKSSLLQISVEALDASLRNTFVDFRLKSIAFQHNPKQLSGWLHYAIVPVLVIVWVIALLQSDISQMNDLGLVSILPVFAYLPLLSLTLSFIIALQTEQIKIPLLILHVVSLIFILYGVSLIIEEMPNFSVNWRHVGIIEHITNNGPVDSSIDAYFNWPSFFIAISFMSQAAGLESSISFVPLSALYFNLLYLIPVYLILKLALNNERATWFGLWLFFISNWIGQDYFSPQALNYFFYLLIVIILLKWFKSKGLVFSNERLSGRAFLLVGKLNSYFAAPEIEGNHNQGNRQKIGLVLLVVIIFAASAISHQLTPFAILFVVTVLVLFNFVSMRNLPLIMGIILASWISFMAVAYMEGHITKILAEIGGLGSSVDENVTARLSGSFEHKIITKIRLIMTLAIWGLAFLGGLWRLYKKQHVVVWALLAGVSFALVGLQDYGGEMLLRVYLFSLPFMLIFVVSLFYPAPTLPYKWSKPAVMFIMTSVLIIGFIFSRYGNQRMDYKTPAEIDGLRSLYDFAEQESLMLAVRPNLAWQFEGYDAYKHQRVDQEFNSGDFESIIDYMKDWDKDAYLILTRSQQVSAEMFLGYTDQDWALFQHKLIMSGLNVIYQNVDTIIYSTSDKQIGENISNQAALDVWATDYHPAISILFIFFLCFVPGKAIVHRLKLADPLVECVLAIALSLALVILVSTSILYIGLWSMDLGFVILLYITLLAIIIPEPQVFRNFITYFRGESSGESNSLRPSFAKKPRYFRGSEYLLILNDFHIADGAENHLSAEMFFHDDDFRYLLEYAQQQAGQHQRQCTLLILGDFVDFLHVRDLGAAPNQERNTLQGIVKKLDAIIDAHETLFKALADFASDGHHVHILAGNHDIEFVLPHVQNHFRKRLCNLTVRSSELSLCFFPWIYYIPGLLYAEHGQQYHDINAFQRMLSWLICDYPEYIEHPIGALLDEHAINQPGEQFAFRRSLYLTTAILSKLIHRLFSDFEGKTLEDYEAQLEQQTSIELESDILLDIDKLAKISTFPLIERLMRRFLLQENISVADTIITQAQSIHGILSSRNNEVPFYVFGHTHQATMKPLFEDGKQPYYLNAGTWAQNQQATEESCLSFIEIISDASNKSKQARLMRWQHDKAETYMLQESFSKGSKLMKVTVLICAYTEERWDDLLEAVASIKAQTVPVHEIVVVIDHNTALFAKAQQHISDVRLIENVEERGLSGARNSGLAIVSGDIIAFMDEDATASPDWLEQLLKGYENPLVWGVGGFIEPLWLSGRPSWFPKEFDWIVGCTYSGMPAVTEKSRNQIGCNMSFRREVFDEIGGFRDGIGRVGKTPVGCEETELCIRANQHQPERIMLYEPKAKVLHRVPGSRANWQYFRSRCYSEGISKALVTTLVGANDGLCTERNYTMRTLPLGVLRGIWDTLTMRDKAGFLRAVAIISGLLITTYGYLNGKLSQKNLSKTRTFNRVETSNI